MKHIRSSPSYPSPFHACNSMNPNRRPLSTNQILGLAPVPLYPDPIQPVRYGGAGAKGRSGGSRR